MKTKIEQIVEQAASKYIDKIAWDNISEAAKEIAHKYTPWGPKDANYESMLKNMSEIIVRHAAPLLKEKDAEIERLATRNKELELANTDLRMNFTARISDLIERNKELEADLAEVREKL